MKSIHGFVIGVGLAVGAASACGYPEATFEGEAPIGPGVGGAGGTPEVVTSSSGPCTDGDKDGVCVETGDCDDADPNTRPGQTAYFQEPRGDGTFDYDCNGADDPEYPNPCAPAGACPGQVGFLQVPACGQSGSFGSCTDAPGPVPACAHQGSGSRVQGCK